MSRPSTSYQDFETLRLITQILTLYYRKGLSQAEVAKRLELSPSKVNRLFNYAHEQGMVEVKIQTPLQHVFEIETRLKAIFDVREAIIVPAVLDDTETLTQAVGAAAARYIETHTRHGDAIVVGGGTTTLATVRELEVKRAYDVTVLPLEGGVQGNIITEVNYVAAELARKLGGRAFLLHAPAFVDTPEKREMLMQLSQIKDIMEMARQANVALVGIGGVNYETSRYVQYTGLSADDMKRIEQEHKGVGEIGSMVFGIEGKPTAVEYANRVVGLTLQELKAIPFTIGVAATAIKALPIYGALRGGYIDVLIADEIAAQGVLEQFNRDFRKSASAAEGNAT
jgi:DNA-binding transcriptional regulator LsrR (DeoR family)